MHAHHVRKVAVVHEAGADDVELAVDPRLVAHLVLEDARGHPEGGLAQQVEHWPVREADAEGWASLDHEEARLAQVERLRRRGAKENLE